MANSIILDTEIDTGNIDKGIEEINNQIDDLIAKQDRIKSLMKQFKDLGGNMNSDTYQEYAKELQNVTAQLEQATQARAELVEGVPLGAELDEETEDLEEETEALEDNAKAVKKVKDASGKAEKAVKKLSNTTKKSNTEFKKAVTNVLKYGIGVASMFRLVNRIRSAVKEGIKSFVQVDASANDAVSSITSSFENLKNSVTSAFAPIITAVAPYITVLIDKLSEAISYISKFFNALQGKTSFTKAKKNMQDYAKSVNNASKSLASFDEINNLNNSNETKASDMFETVEIESNFIAMLDRFKQAIAPISESIQNLFTGINFDPLMQSAQKLWNTLQPILSKAGDAIAWIIDNALTPLLNWQMSEALPAFFDLLATAVDGAKSVFGMFGDTLSDIWYNAIKPLAEYVGDTVMTVFEKLGDFIDKLVTKFADKSDKISNILDFVGATFETVSQGIRVALRVLVAMLDPILDGVVEGIGYIIDALNGVLEFIEGVFTGNWELAWQGIKDVLKGVLNSIITLYETVVNAIVHGLNALSFEVPDWIPSIGGQTWGFNLAELHIPRLATGTVVPRTSKEFGAILGDNNQETEVVSPLSTMKQAMIEALSEAGMNGTANVNVYLEGDAKGVFKLVRTEANNYFNRTGNPAFNG